MVMPSVTKCGAGGAGAPHSGVTRGENLGENLVPTEDVNSELLADTSLCCNFMVVMSNSSSENPPPPPPPLGGDGRGVGGMESAHFECYAVKPLTEILKC